MIRKWLARRWADLKQTTARCWLGDHDGRIDSDGERMFLRCSECGRRTTGWDISGPRLVFLRADPRPAPAAVDLTAIVHRPDDPLALLTVHDLTLAAILADVDERQRGQRVH